MSEAFYFRAGLYDLMFPGGGPAADFYRADAGRQGGRVLELGCGTGHKLIPIASDGHPCTGLDFSSGMLAEAQRKADERGVAVPLEIRSIFPQELPLLVSLGGLRLVERFGDWSGRPFAADSALQLCICESA
jgi:SAM-dependent methyltransferase